VGKVAIKGKYLVKDQEIKGQILGVRDVQDKFRVQIPKIVREKLGLSRKDRVYFVESVDGRIYIARAVKIG